MGMADAPRPAGVRHGRDPRDARGPRVLPVGRAQQDGAAGIRGGRTRPTPPRGLSRRRWRSTSACTSTPTAPLVTNSDPRPIPLDYAIGKSTVSACTACGACVQVCPVGQQPIFDVMYMRRRPVDHENSFPSELQRPTRHRSDPPTPWNLARDHEVGRWAGHFHVEDNPDSTCCGGGSRRRMTSATPRRPTPSPRSCRPPTPCACWVRSELHRQLGPPLRSRGAVLRLATANIETLNEFMASKTQAHRHHLPALHAHAGQGVPPYGGTRGDPQYAVHRQDDGAGQAGPCRAVKGGITLHDPCYLGRMNGVVDARGWRCKGSTAALRCRARRAEASAAARTGRRADVEGRGARPSAVNITRYENGRAERQDHRRSAALLPDHADRRLPALDRASRSRTSSSCRPRAETIVTDAGRLLRHRPRRPKADEAGVCLPHVRFSGALTRNT